MPDYSKTLQEELLLDGRLFTEEIDDNTTNISLLVDNPVDSGIEIVAITARVTHSDSVTITLYDQVSSISGGNPQDAENNFIGHPRTEEASVVRDPTFTGDNIHSEVSYVGAETERILEGNTLAIQPGECVLLDVQDETAAAKDMSILMTWGEIKEGTFR